MLAVLEAGPDRLLGHHMVDREMLAGIAQETDEAHLAEPVAVVQHARRVRAPEVEKARDHRADPVDVVLDLRFGQQRALLRFPARIADHAGRAAHHRDHAMAGELEPAERGEQRQQASDVQAVGGRDKAGVQGELALGQNLAQVGLGELPDDPAGLEILEKTKRRFLSGSRRCFGMDHCSLFS